MLRAIPSTPQHPERTARLLTLIAGILQASVVFVVLFLPVFGRNCGGGAEVTCREYVSYLERGGDWWRFGLLLLIFALGIGAVITSRVGSLSRVAAFCRQATLVTVISVLLELWSFGLYLIPGAALMVVAAFYSQDRQAMQVTVSTLDKRERIARRYTLTAGTLQSLAALGVLFLPIFGICTETSDGHVCNWVSYIQYGGNPIAYAFLFLMVIVGIGAVIINTRPQLKFAVCRLRWMATLFSGIFVVFGAWSIGLLFAPGAVLFLLAALSCRNGRKPTMTARTGL